MRARRVVMVVVLAAAWLVVVGPWAELGSGFAGTGYQERTLAALPAASVWAPPAGPIRVGTAVRILQVPAGHPLAGFSARRPKTAQGVDAPCFARAFSVERDGRVVTVLSADLLFISRRLAAAVLERTGLAGEPHLLYFAATHTHSGPGGWGESAVEEFVAGPYDAAFFDALAATLAEAVMESRRALEPAELATVVCPAGPWIASRIGPDVPVDSRLWAVVARRPEPQGQVLAILAGFAAHALVLGKETHVLSPDYPGALVDELARLVPSRFAMFVAGAVGDATPRRSNAPPPEQARDYGRGLAKLMADAAPAARYDARPRVEAMRWSVETRWPRVHLRGSLSLSPVVSTWLTDRFAHVSVLRLGDAWLVGMPVEFPGHLAVELLRLEQPRRVFVTSLDGDYKGYVVSPGLYEAARGTETGPLNLLGPAGGSYLMDLARRAIGALDSR